jgi:PAS domain S-box-containing protein
VRSHNSQSPHSKRSQLAAAAVETNDSTGETEIAREFRQDFSNSAGGAGYFIIAFTVFLLLLIWGALVYQLSYDKTAVLDAARINTRNLVRAYAEHVVGTLQLVDQMLLRIKNEYESGSVGPEFIQRLNDTSNVKAGVIPIGITDERGYVVASNLRQLFKGKLPASFSPRDASSGDRDYFLALVNDDSGRVYIGEPITSRVTGKQVIALSRRLNKPDGTFAGVAFASFDPEYLSGFFSDLAIGERSSFTIIGRDLIIRDMIRGSGRATDLIGKSVPGLHLVSALARAANGDYTAVSSVDGVARIYAYRTLPDYPLIVLASAAESDIFADYNERQTWIVGAAVALSLIFIVVAGFLLRRMTERSRYEIALSGSRENLARAQQIAAVGSFEHDAISGKADWSDQMYRILGIEKTEAWPGSETLLKLVHPDDHERFVEHRSRELKGERTKPIEYRIIRPDGAERIVRRECAIIYDNANRPVRRYGTLQDITELRLAEQRERELERHLLHSQKLEALGTLAGGIAHDLNNSLTPIMALSKLTARRLDPGNPLRENLETIFTASEQARDLVKRVLAFSRRDKIDKKPTSLREIIVDALKLLRATIPTFIRLDTQIGEVPSILADASQIHQVITNLVSNAAQAIGSKQGVITIALGQVDGSAPRGMIKLSVGDTGEGMDEATQRRIFEPFFTTKQVGQGTGLGLSIIESIVADHGGRIEVESAPGNGARFDIYFPVPDAQAAAA